MARGSISDLVSRVARPAPAVVAVARASGESVLRVALAPDWSRSVIAIDQKLEDLTARRTGLLAERRDLLLDAIDGDGPARARLDKLDRALAALDTDLSRLSDARAVAASKAAEERAAAARRDHAAAIDRFNAAVETLERRAAELDKLTIDYAREVLAVANAAEEARRLCPGIPFVHPSDAVLSAERAHVAVRRNLRARGMGWAWNPPEHPAPPSILDAVQDGAAWARAMIRPPVTPET
jgi:hypothetical protein